MEKQTKMMKKYTTKERKFKFGPDKRFIGVYYNGHFNGFIWNNNRIIYIDGEEIISSEMFK